MTIRIGTRGSPLALWQAEHVKGRLEGRGHEVTLRVITTTGDLVLDRRLETTGGKGAFLKEIEEAMLAGEIDLAVHSLKDVPVVLPPGLRLCAYLERADPRDAWLASGGRMLPDLPDGSRVGTTSLRRQCLLRSLRPGLDVQDLRGNVDTRIRRLHEGRFDAILLAMAGLTRLGRAALVTAPLDPEVFVPAVGQGVIALECREDDAATAAAAAVLDHAPTARRVVAERTFLGVLEGGCNVPLGAHAVLAGESIRLSAFVGRADGSALVRTVENGVDAADVGRRAADSLLGQGARELLP